MGFKKKIKLESITIIENALTRLKEQPRFILPEQKLARSVNRDSHLSNTTILTAFADLVLDSQETENLVEHYKRFNQNEPEVKVFGATNHAFMWLLGIDSTVTIELLLPSRGDFDWGKSWESQQLEADEYAKYVERVISRHFGYRLFKGQAVKAS